MNESEQQVEALFEAALKLTADERTAYLDQSCAGNAELRRQVERLLSAFARAGDFLQSPTEIHSLKKTIQALPTVPVEKPGDRIGHYKLLQQIGEGGCGVVYMAEQTEPVRRRVALKVIKLGMDTKQVIARFEAERQALALMDHPNIARVLDAGATQTGRPYFVMELVRGTKITEFCDENSLSTEARLKLFIQVCQAVQHAHQKGIIHRDLKPSNILVSINDDVFVPKVIDFGVSKATGGQILTDKTVFTAFEQFIGTPAYMSPEQALMTSHDIDTRSDIYSLGVLLYELLTGRPPFEETKLLQRGVAEMLRVLREEEPPRPSSRLSTLEAAALTTTAKQRHTEPPKLIHVIRGDLDWIVMKCLEKDRTRRYETANGLALDIERHLRCEPVVARPPSKLYEFQRAVRRHKLGFAATAAVVTSLLVSSSVSVWMYLKEKEARDSAVAASHDAELARANEKVLRQKTEAREKTVQAKLLYNDGDLEGAERLLNQIPTEFIQPDPVHSSLRRALGCWRALQEQWTEAVTNFAILEQVDALDGDYNITLDCLLNGPALVESGDKDGYDLMRRRAIARFRGTDNSIYAERICKVSLLLPAAPDIMQSLNPLYEVAVRDLHDETIDLNQRTWTYMSLAMVDYRRNNFEKVINWCHQCLASSVRFPTRTTIVQSLLAMAYHRLNRPSEAKAALAEAHKEFDQINRGGVFLAAPADWPHGRIMLREADALINGKSSAPTAEPNVDSQSQYSLGRMYAQGDGVSQDWGQALYWYRKAGERGHAAAQYSLGIMYANGQGVAKDPLQALKWFQQAAEQDYPAAQYSLGRLYADGVVKSDPGEAAKWFRKAAESGNADAQCSLATMYATGHGATRDLAQAVNWYGKAANQENIGALRGITWLRATCEDSRFRDGRSAVLSGEKGVALTGRHDAAMMDALAAAYAEAGDFAKAIDTESVAVSLTEDEATKTQFVSRRRLYQSGSPYRESAVSIRSSSP